MSRAVAALALASRYSWRVRMERLRRARELASEEAASASSPFSAVVDEAAVKVDGAFVSALAPTG